MDAREGDEVLAFYRASSHPRGFLFAHLGADAASAAPAPLLGLTAGWLPARVLEARSPEAHEVRVRFLGGFADPFRGTTTDLELALPAELVRPAAAGPPPVPLLSVLCVRWWNYWDYKWWSDYNVTSAAMLGDLLDGAGGLWEALQTQHEVHTVFVRSGADLAQISERWALEALRGQQKCAWYFLWPVAASPFAEARAGTVCERQFFDLAVRMECAGVETGWPHPSQLYRLLCGKLWVAQMCLQSEWRVPPTAQVHVQRFRADPGGAVAGALRTLGELQRRVWREEPAPVEAFRGVAKLGFSWQGQDVVPFAGPEGLRAALGRLFGQAGSQQVTCLVQRMVPHVVCEQRVLAVWDAAAGRFAQQRVYLRLFPADDRRSKSTVDGFALTSALVVRPEDAAVELFGGDAAACREVEEQVDALAERWLLWASAQCAEPPPVLRLDFIISRPPDASAAAAAWTCEVTECGASFCGLEVDSRSAAAVNYALRHLKAEGGGFPRPLPPLRFKEKPNW